MRSSTCDSCLLINRGDAFRLIRTQADDMLIVGKKELSRREEENFVFKAKPKRELSIDTSLHFNGCI